MKKIIFLTIGILLSTVSFSQKDSVWVAKYSTENGVTRYLGTTTLKQPVTEITDSKLKVIGTIDAFGNLILSAPKQRLLMGRYAVFNSIGQILYLVKID